MQHGTIHVTSKVGLDIAPNPKSAKMFQWNNASDTQKMNTLALLLEPDRDRRIHGKSIRTCEQVNQLEDITSLLKPGSRPDHDGNAAETHLKDRNVVVGFRTLLSI